MTKPVIFVQSILPKVGIVSFMALQLLTGCSVAPKPAQAQEVLTRALASTSDAPAPLAKNGEYVLLQTDQYRIRAKEPADPFHKQGLRPETIQIKMWQLGDGGQTFKIQHLNPTSGEIVWEMTQSVVNGQIYRTVRDTLAAVEFTTVIPPYDVATQDPDVIAAESARRTKLLEILGRNATVSTLQSTVTGKPIFRVVSRIPFDPASTDALIVDEALLRLLGQTPQEILKTYDVDSEAYVIIGQSTVAVMPDRVERLIESTQLVSRTTGPASDLTTNWFAIKYPSLPVSTYGFDIHQEVAAGRATEEIKMLAEGRVISIISGPKSALSQGLQGAAPVWQVSNEVALEIAGAQQQAWLCEGGVLASDPVRRLLIFTTADKLFYVTGQSFDTNEQFLQAVQAQLGG